MTSHNPRVDEVFLEAVREYWTDEGIVVVPGIHPNGKAISTNEALREIRNRRSEAGILYSHLRALYEDEYRKDPDRNTWFDS